jgi:hypothetical protein
MCGVVKSPHNVNAGFLGDPYTLLEFAAAIVAHGVIGAIDALEAIADHVCVGGGVLENNGGRGEIFIDEILRLVDEN